MARLRTDVVLIAGLLLLAVAVAGFFGGVVVGTAMVQVPVRVALPASDRPVARHAARHGADGIGTMALQTNGVLRVSGVITPDLNRSVRALDAAAYHTVVLDSIGGDVGSAIDMAKGFRAHGVRTHVSAGGHCYSACTVLYQAGTYRTAHPDADLLYHYARQVSDDENISVRGSVWGTVQVIEALIEFDADPMIYDHMPGIGDWVLSPEQARDLNIVQLVTTETVVE